MKTTVSLFASLLPLWSFLISRQLDHSIHLSQKEAQLVYDYIVVGGGTAGCVLANRLSEDKSKTVLLLEAGGSESMITDFPIAVLNLQNTPLDWGYQTEVQTSSCFGLKRRRQPWPRGKLLGGCSVLNYMMYVRGNPRDYDLWAQQGNYGWQWKDVFPYFIKSEDNRDPELAFNGYHGRGGPLTVSTSKQISPIAKAFVEAGKHLGYPNIDVNGYKQTGFMIPQATIRRGARCSTAKAFLYDVKERDNLHVLTFALVTKVLFDSNKRANGVIFDRFGLSTIVFSNKEVILSAGSVNSPQLLMLSGVGPKSLLKKLNIPLISDLPVGKNLQDHIYPGGLHFTLPDDHEDNDITYMQRKIQKPKNFFKYLLTGSGPLASTGGLEGLGFIKTKYVNQSNDWPDFEIHLVCACLSSDDGRVFRHNVAISEQIWQKVYLPHINKQCFSLFPVILRPKSVGYLSLRSANPYDPPLIQPNYLTHPKDIKTMVEAMKQTILLGQTPPLKRLGAKIIPQVIPGCEHYIQWSDEYLACVARTLTHTIYHPVGTCKMGPVDSKDSVVDPQLRVIGVKGLRVADGSIMPQLVSGNTNAPIIMIAEKASDLIKQENNRN